MMQPEAAETGPLPGAETLDLRPRSVRIETLILLRWIAVIGQATAILVAWRHFGIDINLGLSLALVGAAVAVNLVSLFAARARTQLDERAATLALLFDTLQLAALLFLTGGLNNPFAALILAPATVAAAALGPAATALVAGVTIAAATVLGLFAAPLRMADGRLIEVPPLFGFGFWLAIVIGVIFLGLYARRIASEVESVNEALLATQMALAREQALTDLGGVVAAAAHELGTPLATIMLVSTELAEELADRPELAEDAVLIRSQAQRCREILRSMGRTGKTDLMIRSAPLLAVLEEAAEPHADRGRELHFTLQHGTDLSIRQPAILRKPEIIHGLRNLIQNAVDFAQKEVWIDAWWDETTLGIEISDDGPGFPQHMLGRIGDPFGRRRRAADPRAGRHYEGMGLGLFIAKTLLERTGARLRFGNGADPFLSDEERRDRSGAVVRLTWPRRRIEGTQGGALGENRPIVAG